MFDNEYTTARIGEDVVSFTEAESRVLRHMTRHPGQVLTRSQLLDAVTETGSDRSDRSIDFIINRIRRKLRDDHKSPAFIQTRYGGGYIWVGEKATSALAENCHVIIGAMRGVDDLDTGLCDIDAFLSGLSTELRATLPADQKVGINPAMSARSLANHKAPAILIEIVFFRDAEGVECIVSCRSGLSGRVYLAQRLRLAPGPHPVGRDALRSLALRMSRDRWRSDIEHESVAAPLPIAMHDTLTQARDSRAAVREMEPKVAELRSAHPDDPQIKLLHATLLHTDLIVNGFDIARRHPERRATDLALIERLTLDALEFSQSQPHLAVMAGKLLYFVDPGYRELALELSENVHRTNASVAASLAMVGQFQSFLGNTDTAVRYLKEAAAVAEEGSRFEVYVMVMLCQALIAGGRRDELGPHRERVYRYHPALRLAMEPVFADPERPSLRAKGAMMVLSRKRARALLDQMNFAWVRLLVEPEHRANALRGPISLAVRRHGPGVVPKAVARNVPSLVCN